MKKTVRMMLTAAIVAAIGLGMGSCTDKIDNSVTPSDNPQEQQAVDAKAAKAEKYWSVVSHLVDIDDYTPDYEDKTFEPVYGVSRGDDGTRYVFTNTAAAAAERFADLVDVKEGIDENTASYTFEDADIGTLIYKKGSGRELATVDVSIKQIPGLKKIVYVPGAYANGTFTGRAYYRFGDVIKRKADGYPNGQVDEYWICVRPAFGKEGKEDSHWVCLNVLPKKNVFFYHSDTNKRDYYLPTSLGTSVEHMQNLAEMLYAIYNPQKWEENISYYANSDGKLEMFTDFSPTNLKFHNQYFWKNVQRQWRDKGIIAKAFNFSGTEEEFKNLLFGSSQQPVTSGLHLLYSGYSWYQSLSWNCTLYEAVYKNGYANKELNMHQATTQKHTRDMREVNLDCRKMGLDNYFDYVEFFNDGGHCRWTVRHATGKELTPSGAAYDKKTMISGTEVVYRYYQHAYPTEALGDEPEVTPADPSIDKNYVQVGNVIAQNGKFYSTVEDAETSGNGAKAIVVWVGGNKRAEKDANWNGLAIALQDVTKNDGNQGIAFSEEKIAKVLCTSNVAVPQHAASRRNGWTMTQLMKDKCHNGHSHPAAEAVGALQPIEGCSSWFIPSTGQWDLAMQGMGFGTLSKDPVTSFWKYLTQGTVSDMLNLESDMGYMTCNECFRGEVSEQVDSTDAKYWYFNYSSTLGNIQFMSAQKHQTDIRVRPFLAFKYGDGGSVNPEESWAPLAQPQVRSWLGGDGKFYKTGADVYTSTGRMPAGYVFFYGNPGSIDVFGDKYRGIAIGLGPNELKGLSWDQRYDVLNAYDNSLPSSVRKQNGFSDWFVGSKEHWAIAIQNGFGMEFVDDAVPEEIPNSKQMEIQQLFRDNYVGKAKLMGHYWTDTSDEDHEENAWYLNLSFGSIKFNSLKKSAYYVSREDEEMCVRPMMAF